MHPNNLASIITTCLAIAILSGCKSSSYSEQPASPAAAIISQQTMDEQVIEAALVDLVSSSDGDSEILRIEQGKGRLAFSNQCMDWAGSLREAQSKPMGSADASAAKEAAANAAARVKNHQLFAPFHPKDPRISLWEEDPASTQPLDPFAHFQKRRPIQAAPPGYADQRRLAIVNFGFAWSIHGGEATYLLRFDGQGWHVISRNFVYYV